MRLFAEAVGGWAKLISSTMQDGAGNGGGSKFEVAIQGNLVTAPEASPATVSLTEALSIPDDVEVVLDSSVNRLCLKMILKNAVDLAGAQNWTFIDFDNGESTQPHLRKIRHRTNVVVTLDDNMQSSGGYLLGSQVITWLVGECRFQGIIIGADPTASQLQLDCGATFNLTKPIKIPALVRADLERAFADHSDRPLIAAPRTDK